MLGQNQQTKEKRRSAKMRNQSERISRVNEISGQVRPQTKPFFHFVGIRDGHVPSKQFIAVQLVVQAYPNKYYQTGINDICLIDKRYSIAIQKEFNRDM